jgi:Right handed beta helix region
VRAGRYRLGRPLVLDRPGVTLRAASGRVVIDGGYDAGELIQVAASRVTLTDLTLTRAQDHLVHAVPPPGQKPLSRLRLHRLRLVDSGEQFVKVNSNAARTATIDRGSVTCSRFAMTAAGRGRIERAFGCYTGGIDAHLARGWRVRRNSFRGIYCEDGEVAEHAIHFWSGSSGTVVERNTIRDCSRGIGFGLGAGASTGHRGGRIARNVIRANVPQYDTGIGLEHAAGARVVRNRVVETARAPRAFASIDLRFPGTSALVSGNRVKRIVVRDGARARLRGNRTG